MSIEVKAAGVALVSGIAVVAIAFGAASILAPHSSPSPPTSAHATSPAATASSDLSQDIISGGQYFQVSCARCHGSEGAGGSFAPSLHNEDLSNSDIASTIAAGSGRMPAFSKTYNGGQIQDLVKYIRTLN